MGIQSLSASRERSFSRMVRAAFIIAGYEAIHRLNIGLPLACRIGEAGRPHAVEGVEAVTLLYFKVFDDQCRDSRMGFHDPYHRFYVDKAAEGFEPDVRGCTDGPYGFTKCR